MTAPQDAHVLALAHGALGWAAAVGLGVVAVLALFCGWSRRIQLAAAAAVLVATLTAALGFVLEPAYEDRLRQRLFVRSPSLGWLFERKLHAAIVAVLLAWSGLFLLVALRRARAPELRAELRRAATVGFAVAAALAALAAIAASFVARVVHF